MSRAGPSTVFNFRGNGDGQWISIIFYVIVAATKNVHSTCTLWMQMTYILCYDHDATQSECAHRQNNTVHMYQFTQINTPRGVRKKAMLRFKHLTSDKEGHEGSTIHWPPYFTEEKISRMAIAWCFPANSRFSCVCSGCKSEEESRPPFDELFDGLFLLR